VRVYHNKTLTSGFTACALAIASVTRAVAEATRGKSQPWTWLSCASGASDLQRRNHQTPARRSSRLASVQRRKLFPCYAAATTRCALAVHPSPVHNLAVQVRHSCNACLAPLHDCQLLKSRSVPVAVDWQLAPDFYLAARQWPLRLHVLEACVSKADIREQHCDCIIPTRQITQGIAE